MIPSEILPLNIRTQGSALSTASNWISNFIVVKFTPSALANIGFRTYIIFAIFNALWVPILWSCLPETKGRTFEELDILFERKVPARKFKDYNLLEEHDNDGLTV